MKSTGIVRCIDELGRIVLPVEIRKALDLSSKDGVDISVEGHRIILEKHEPKCVFCGTKEKTQEYAGRRICAACLEDLKNNVEIQPEEEKEEEPKLIKQPRKQKTSKKIK